MGSFRPDPNILKKHPGAVTQAQIDEKSRFLGALLGAAAGESLGAPHENKTVEGLADDATAASRITHYDPRCVAGCIGVTTAIAWLVRGGKDAEEAVERAAGAAGAVSDDVRMVIERGAVKKPDQLTVDGED